jgi:type II secretory pathway pseudopilin PulG
MTKMFPLLLLATLAAPSLPQSLTKEERERAMSELHATRKLFLDSLAGLSEAQWNFKPAPEVWSVAECAEHIALSEDRLYELVTQKLMKAPAEPEKKTEVKGKEELVLEKTTDRSQKFQAPEMLRPTHQWPSKDDLIAHFRESRDRTIAYVERTPDDLREHFASHPAFKLLDGY